VDAAFWGTMRWGYFRWGVYRDDWDKLLKAFESIASHDLTLRKLALGARDSTTGWRAKSYTESTIEGIFTTRAAGYVALPAGTYVKLDALLLTADGVAKGDEIQHSDGEYYEVKTVKPHSLGDSFWFRECDLTHLPLHT